MQPESVAPTLSQATPVARWHVERLRRSLGSHGAAWDLLNDSRYRSHPLLTSCFVNGLLSKFGSGKEHLCRLVDDHGELKAACILQHHRFGVWSSFLPAQAQLGLTLLSSFDELQGLCSALPGRAQAIELLCLDAALPPVESCRTPEVRVVSHAVTVSVDLEGEFDAFWSDRSKSLRHNMRRYQRRLDELMPDSRLHVTDEPLTMRAAVQRYAELEGRGWKGREGTALASTPEQLQFYSDLMETEAARGRAFVLELVRGSQLLASRLILSGPNRVVILKTTFDESLRDLAAGRLLLLELLKVAFERYQGRSLDFYTSATSEQLAWANREHSIVHATIYRDRVRALLAGLRGTLRRPKRRDSDSGDSEDSAIEEQIRWTTSIEALQASERNLLDSGETESFLAGSGWFGLFERSVMGQSGGARYASLSRGALVKAVLPLNCDPELLKSGGNVGSMANWYSTRWMPALSRGTIGADLVNLMESLREGLGRQPRLVFSPLLAGSRELEVMQDALTAAGFRVHRHCVHGNWHLPVVSDWNSYLATRNGPLRSTIKRMTRQCFERGGRIDLIHDGPGLDAGIQAYQTVYAKSWKKAEPQEGFMPEMMRLCAARGWLRLGVLYVDQQPVAAQVWVVAHGRAAIYKIAYDEAFSASRPGTVLTAHMIKHAIEQDRVHEIDYLTGDDNYKRDWMSHRRELHALVAYDMRQWRGQLMWLRGRIGNWWRTWRERGDRSTKHSAAAGPKTETSTQPKKSTPAVSIPAEQPRPGPEA